jgi:hypothetical protein
VIEEDRTIMTRRDAVLRYAAATLLTQANDEPARRLQHEREAYEMQQGIPPAYRAELETLTAAQVLALAAAALASAARLEVHRPVRPLDPSGRVLGPRTGQAPKSGATRTSQRTEAV